MSRLSAIDSPSQFRFKSGMKIVLYLLILFGATVLSLDLAKEVKEIEKKPMPEPTQPVEVPTEKSSQQAPAQWQEQLAAASSKIKAAPKDATLYVRRANLYMQANQVEKAITDLDQAITLDPENTEFLLQRGSTQMVLGKLAKALPDFTRVLELKPSHTRALVYRAIIYFRQGKHQESINDCTRILELEPSYTDVHLTIARSYRSLDNTPKAIEHLKKYIDSTSDPEGKAEAESLMKQWQQPQ